MEMSLPEIFPWIQQSVYWMIKAYAQYHCQLLSNIQSYANPQIHQISQNFEKQELLQIPLKVSNPKNFTGRLARKIKWSETEDELLLSYVRLAGEHSWAEAARRLNELIHENHVVREGKHVRERWINYLNPSLNSEF